MYCLDCARAGARAEPGASPEAVLHALRDLGERGDTGARRLFFGILWDGGRSILCYRCKRGRPVRLGREQSLALGADAGPRPAPSTTPTTAVGEKALEGSPRPLDPGTPGGDRRAA